MNLNRYKNTEDSKQSEQWIHIYQGEDGAYRIGTVCDKCISEVKLGLRALSLILIQPVPYKKNSENKDTPSNNSATSFILNMDAEWLTVLYLSLKSMNSLNKTHTAVFTLLLHLLLPGYHITKIYLHIFIILYILNIMFLIWDATQEQIQLPAIIELTSFPVSILQFWSSASQSKLMSLFTIMFCNI